MLSVITLDAFRTLHNPAPSASEIASAIRAIDRWCKSEPHKLLNANGDRDIPDPAAKIDVTDGSLTFAGIQRIITTFDSIEGGSHFIDLGSGDGRIVLYASILSRRCTRFTGVEVVRSRFRASMEQHPTLAPVYEFHKKYNRRVEFFYNDFNHISIQPILRHQVSHIYMFDPCFTAETHMSLDSVLSHSTSVCALATCHPIATRRWTHTRELFLPSSVTTVKGRMSVSRQQFSMQVYRRKDTLFPLPKSMTHFYVSSPLNTPVIRQTSAREISHAVQEIMDDDSKHLSFPIRLCNAEALVSKYHHVFENQFESLLHRQLRIYRLLLEWYGRIGTTVTIQKFRSRQTINVVRKTDEPPRDQMDALCSLRYGKTSLAISGMVGVYFADHVGDVAADPKHITDNSRRITRLQTNLASGGVHKQSSITDKALIAWLKSKSTNSVSASSARSSSSAEAAAAASSSSSSSSGVDDARFVATYDGFFMTDDELDDMPFRVNTTYELSHNVITSLGLAGSLNLVGNPLAVGPMLNDARLPPGYTKQNMVPFHANCITDPINSDATKIDHFRTIENNTMTISSLLLTIRRIPNETIEQREANPLGEAFLNYDSENKETDTKRTKKKKKLSLLNRVNAAGMYTEECYVCFRHQQSLDNQLIKCRSPRCTRTYHRHCIHPHIERFKTWAAQLAWTCPLHDVVLTHTIVHPSLGRFYPRYEEPIELPESNTTYLSANHADRITSDEKLNILFNRARRKSVLDNCVFWGLSCGSSKSMPDRFDPVKIQKRKMEELVDESLHHHSLASFTGLALRARTNIPQGKFIILDHHFHSHMHCNLWSTLHYDEYGTGILPWIHMGTIDYNANITDKENDSFINTEITAVQNFNRNFFDHRAADAKQWDKYPMTLPLVLKTTHEIKQGQQIFFAQEVHGGSIRMPLHMRHDKIKYTLGNERLLEYIYKRKLNDATVDASLYVTDLSDAIKRWSMLVADMGELPIVRNLNDGDHRRHITTWFNNEYQRLLANQVVGEATDDAEEEKKPVAAAAAAAAAAATAMVVSSDDEHGGEEQGDDEQGDEEQGDEEQGDDEQDDDKHDDDEQDDDEQGDDEEDDGMLGSRPELPIIVSSDSSVNDVDE